MDGGEKSFVYISRVPVLQTDTGSQEEEDSALYEDNCTEEELDSEGKHTPEKIR